MVLSAEQDGCRVRWLALSRVRLPRGTNWHVRPDIGVGGRRVGLADLAGFQLGPVRAIGAVSRRLGTASERAT
jgi:hypothetical protein